MGKIFDFLVKSKSSKRTSRPSKPKKRSTTSFKVKESTSKIKASSTPSKGRNKEKRVAKNEFRYNNQTRHPNYIFEEQGNKYHSVGFTHRDATFGIGNMPLEKNPQKGKEEKAYVRNGIITSKKKNYSNLPINNMQFSDSDFKNVKAKVRNYKKRRKK